MKNDRDVSIFDAERCVPACIIEVKTRLGIRDAVIPSLPLEPGIPGFSPGLHPSEEGFGREIHTFGVIL
jgi:hypothetical protein